MRKITKRSAAIAAAVVLGVGAAGAAWAWVIGGSGTGTATAATVQSLGVTATISPDLYPTGSVNVTAHVTNPNTFPVVISGGTATVTSAPPGCSISKVSSNPVSLSPTVPIPANTLTAVPVLLADALTMAADAQQACAGGTFGVSVNLTANTPTS